MGVPTSFSSDTVQLPSNERVFELTGERATWLWVRTCAVSQCDCRSAFVVVTEAGREAVLQQGAVRGALDASRIQWQRGSSSACSGKSNHQIKFGRSVAILVY